MALWACALREYQVVKGWAGMDISGFSFFHIHPLPFSFCKSASVWGFGAFRDLVPHSNSGTGNLGAPPPCATWSTCD